MNNGAIALMKCGYTEEQAHEIRREYTRLERLAFPEHVVPIHVRGFHKADNLQIIYATENSAKGYRLNYVPSVIFR